MPKSTVGNILKKYNESGNLAPMPRSGRPRVLSEKNVRYICRKVKNKPDIGSISITSVVNQELNVSLTARSVRNYLIRNNLRAFRKAKKPLLTNKMMKRRYEWGKNMIKKADKFWESVLFSDECYISLNSGDQIYSRRPRLTKNSNLSTNYFSMAPKHPVKVMIWGCFSSKGPGMLKIVDGTMKSRDYLNVLETKMLPSARDLFGDNSFIYQDDSAPCHRSKIVKEWENSRNIEVLEWPGNSPDMNPIENLWAILKQKVRTHRPTNKSELISAISASWTTEISVNLCQKLSSSMKNRIEALVDNKGGPTKY